MTEDMTIRKLAPKTQHDYVQRVKNFTAFLGRSPATASKEDVRRYQLHLASNGAHTPKINSTVSALRTAQPVVPSKEGKRDAITGRPPPYRVRLRRGCASCIRG
jgi:hypothetical protein